jgi:CheY-like chemotaxis protein
VQTLSSQPTVLIVDDDRSTRMLMRAFLARLQHRVVEASNGQEAIEVFSKENPDIIIMDVTMPVMSGYEAATIIKQQYSQRFVPIIFLTGLNDEDSLAKCLESGGDDFLAKPFNPTLLQAKINAMRRIQSMHGQLEDYQRRTEEELTLAKHVFNTLTMRVREEVPGLETWTQSAGHLPGDLVLYDKTPSGRIYAMLGDFTGHGFSAAIGALPVADVFFAMTKKDIKLSEVISEINRKLHEILPTGHFCAAFFASFDPEKGNIKVWNGGLPEAFLVDQQRNIVQRFPSQSFALGIVDSKFLDIELVAAKSSAPGTLVAYSDGLTEAVSSQGEMFGSAGLEDTIRGSQGKPLFDTIRHAVLAHLDQESTQDDVSLLVIPIND